MDRVTVHGTSVGACDSQSLKNSKRPHLPSLYDEVDVSEGHILQLGLSREERDQWRGELLQQGAVVVQVFGQHLHELH